MEIICITSDSVIIATGIAIFVWYVAVSWMKYTRKRFTAKLKYGNDWHIHLNVEEYSFYGAKFWLKKPKHLTIAEFLEEL